MTVFEAKVASAEDLSPRARGLRLELAGGARMPFRAGQHARFLMPQPDGSARPAYFSIASPPGDGASFEICAGLIPGGRAAEFVSGLRPGDAVRVEGPGGNFGLAEPFERDVVFVAVGTGIAPLRSMARDLLARGTGRNVYLLYGNREETDILYRKEWDALAEARRNRFHRLYTLSRPSEDWPGARGYVQEHLEDFPGDLAAKDFYLCGMTAMIEDVKAKLRAAGVPEERIRHEKYG